MAVSEDARSVEIEEVEGGMKLLFHEPGNDDAWLKSDKWHVLDHNH